MHVPRSPHRWRVTPKRAIEIQNDLAGRVQAKGQPKRCRLVAGTDLAFENDGTVCVAGVVLWDAHAQSVVEQHVCRKAVTIPYVPGLLSFREAPAILAVLKKLRQTPDVIICDGHGLAHQRRFGLACHIGVILNLPTIGCAKSRLIGEHREPAAKRGSRTGLTDRGDRVGTVLRTKNNVRPVYVSIGHRIDLKAAERVVLACTAGYRLPEPTRLADRLVAAAKKTE